MYVCKVINIDPYYQRQNVGPWIEFLAILYNLFVDIGFSPTTVMKSEWDGWNLQIYSFSITISS